MCHLPSPPPMFFRFFVMLILLVSVMCLNNFVYTQDIEPSSSVKQPAVSDPKLKSEMVFNGFSVPTGMAFLGPDDILIIEKNTGKVKEIRNGTLIGTILDVSAMNFSEGGLLGITISNKPKNVFLYYTETQNFDGGKVLGNRLYKYDYIDGKLINPKLLLELPAKPGPGHSGGKIEIASDNNIYLVIGDVKGSYAKSSKTMAQNFKNGTEPDGRAGILRITQAGKAVSEKGILGDEFPMNLYYAYGIRNSFGIDFDPLTGKLWDTENGPDYGDEINLVEPGFNSGWSEVQGIWEPQYNPLDNNSDMTLGNELLDPHNLLVDFGAKGKYSPPEFTWKRVVAPTDIVFLKTEKLGKQYENDMFVGDSQGHLYHFDLNNKRTELFLKGPLSDKVANNSDEFKKVVFAKGFGTVSDLQVGPDGYLYVLSTIGNLYRIVPTKIN
jgi:aldose sugar dehydrogenase